MKSFSDYIEEAKELRRASGLPELKPGEYGEIARKLMQIDREYESGELQRKIEEGFREERRLARDDELDDDDLQGFYDTMEPEEFLNLALGIDSNGNELEDEEEYDSDEDSDMLDAYETMDPEDFLMVSLGEKGESDDGSDDSDDSDEDESPWRFNVDEEYDAAGGEGYDDYEGEEEHDSDEDFDDDFDEEEDDGFDDRKKGKKPPPSDKRIKDKKPAKGCVSDETMKNIIGALAEI